MKKEKELIEEIVDRIKSSNNYKYKEGAWEKFQSYEKSATPVFRIQKYVAAALVLMFGAAAIYYYSDFDDKQLKDVIVPDAYVSVQQKTDDLSVDEKLDAFVEKEIAYADHVEGRGKDIYKTNSEQLFALESNAFELLDRTPNLDVVINEVKNSLKVVAINPIQSEDYKNVQTSQELRSHLIAANASLSKRLLSNTKMEQLISPKFFQFADRFELGLFISPFTNSENLKVGAGLTFSYNISKKISLRTGASFNTYEVGILKNPLDDNSVEQVLVSVDNSALISPEPPLTMQTARVAMPNINAVTGFVQSLEVPLEVQYKLNKSFYAVAGLSYSTIISQERNAHYMENINTSASIDKESMQQITPVSKTIKSAMENVNPNTFSGFVNLSVGKKVNVNHKFGVSIEPYYKIPLGGFRKADMNYSNAGVRIMTNF